MPDGEWIPRELRGLNLNHLFTFFVVARSPTLTAAATEMRTAPSSVSAQVRELERWLGAELFERKKGAPLHLNAEGRKASAQCEALFGVANELVRDLRGTQHHDAGRGILRLGVASSISDALAGSFLLPLFRRPEMQAMIRSGASHDLINDLLRNEISLVLTHDAPLQLAQLGLKCRSLSTTEYLVVVARAVEHRIRDFPEDLGELSMIRHSTSSIHRAAEDQFLVETGLQPSVLAETDSLDLTLNAVVNGHGFAVIPERAGLPCLDRDEIVVLHRLDASAQVFGVFRGQDVEELVRAALDALADEPEDDE